MTRLISILLLGMLVAQPVRALTVSATYSGTVTEGYDQNGEFGLGSDAVLDGQAATMVFLYDTALGNRSTTTEFDAIFSGSDFGTAPAILSFGVTINGVTLSGSPTSRATMWTGENGPVSGISHWAQDILQTEFDYHQDYALVGAEAPLGVFPNSLDTPFSAALTTLLAADFGFIDLSLGGGPSARFTYGSLDLTGIRVEALDPSPVPLPAGLPLLALAIGATGLFRRFRAA